MWVQSRIRKKSKDKKRKDNKEKVEGIHSSAVFNKSIISNKIVYIPDLLFFYLNALLWFNIKSNAYKGNRRKLQIFEKVQESVFADWGDIILKDKKKIKG